MKCFVSFLLLLAILGVNSYDFDDSAFNEYLFKELRSLQDDGDSSFYRPEQRTRRDAEVKSSTEKDLEKCPKPSWKRNLQCCKGSSVNEEALKIFENYKKECATELKREVADDAYDPFDCEKMQQVKEKIICMSECVSNKFNGLTKNGTSMRDVILEHLAKQIGDVEWKKAVAEKNVDKCLAEVKEKREQHEKEGKQIVGCSPWLLSFQGCMWRQWWSGCPAELQVDTPKCKKLRERVAEGKDKFFRQHFLYKYYHMGE